MEAATSEQWHANDYVYGPEDDEDLLGELEVSGACRLLDNHVDFQKLDGLEQHLTQGIRMHSSASSSSMPSLSLSQSLPSTDSTFSVKTLKALRPPPAPLRNPSNRSTHAPLHTSASELFTQNAGYTNLKSPPMTRQTTYSSLPGSPTEDLGDIFFEARGALAMRDLNRLIDDKLRTGSDGDGSQWGSDEGSERPADDAFQERHLLSRSPSPPHDVDTGHAGHMNDEVASKRLTIWDLLKEEVTTEDWEGWGVESKWFVIWRPGL
jgi:hypothetical protein